MKKQSKSFLDKARDIENGESDPVDGTKMIGCLFVGIVLLGMMLYIFSVFIKYLR